ncbi:MAG: YbaN family protein [Candidatus Hydrogenedentes bacterium]|nr:YbaN family protein [Candidatus Hydrogenedentota bacterium]
MRSPSNETCVAPVSELEEALRLSPFGVRRPAWIAGGHAAFVLALVGVVLPLLPTTPLLLLAAYCYARGSVRFYLWLVRNRYFGPIISAWREHGTMPRRTKAAIMAALVAVMGATVLFVAPVMPGKILLACLGCAILVVVARIPAAAPE